MSLVRPAGAGTLELVDQHTLAYVAGVVDLLGHIKVREMANGTRLPAVTMYGNFMPTLEYLAGLTGTKAIKVRRSYSRAGCAEHCAEKHQHIVSVSGRWQLVGAKATIMLWNIRPYMRLQAETAATVMHVGFDTQFKPASLEKMRSLGWDVPEF